MSSLALDGDTHRPLYHELDISLEEKYANDNRGVGRLVYLQTGFDADNYGHGQDVVCLYTDDHYATFAEYDNLGGFLPRFAAECRVVNEVWGEPSLIA